MVSRKNDGLTLTELLIVVAILAILILVALLAYRAQIAKGRDAKRKADLDKIQTVFEDYLNDNNCYPNSDEITSEIPNHPGFRSICGKSLPCDPLNNLNYNYFYSFDSDQTCKRWYKIYTRLENAKDSIIEKVGCAGGCGPSGNYNYWVSSPNMSEVAQLPGEAWWPSIPGVFPTLPPGVSPTPPPMPSPTPGASPTPELTLTPTPTPGPGGDKYYGCFSGICKLLSGSGECSPNYVNYPNCDPGGEYQCGTPEKPKNECH